MSRIRTVKPELFKHEDLFDAEQDSKLPLRLAFIGLLTVADCEGRFKWRPRTLKLEVLPHDFIDFASVLNALEQGGFIQSYEVDGELYGWIPNFRKHQRLQTKELAAGSSLPVPCLQEKQGTHSVRTPERTGTHPEVQEGKGKEEEGKRINTAPAPDTHTDPPSAPRAEPEPATPTAAAQAIAPPPKARIPDEFETFWQEYPTRAGGNPKAPALKAWNARRKDGHTAAAITNGARRYAAYCHATGKLNTEYVKQASTFLNQLSFLDPWNLPTPTPQRTGPRAASPPHALTPEAAHFETLLRNLNRPVIEGEIAHELH